MAASIPIPRMPPSHSPHRPHHHNSYHAMQRERERERERETDRERDRQREQQIQPRRSNSPASVGRSPPSLSSSSYRTHPYSRQMAQPASKASKPETLPRIHLPPPNIGGSMKYSPSSDSHSPRDREFPSLTSLETWRSRVGERRPSISRLPSGGKIGSGISLPPLHSMTGGSAISPNLPPAIPSSNMPPPSLESSAGSSSRASPRFGPPTVISSNSAHSGTAVAPNLRPSYGFEHRPSRRSPSAGAGSRYPEYSESERRREFERERERGQAYEAVQHSRGHTYAHHAHSHSHSHSQGPYDMPSPPLRALPPSSLPLVLGSYMAGGYRGPGGHSVPNLTRPRSQSSTSGLSRPGAGTSASEEGPEGMVGREMPPTPGQSRRLAHLMSEQKRRESINTGFQALRTTLPSALPTDSKAIILRKAVAHITHLEMILRRSGVSYSNSPPGGMTGGEMWGEADRDPEEETAGAGAGGKWDEDR
ncbi:hypothetical protein IAR55_004351 [Kwoniella newhampshirensis]|uniref:BHLH domain-containing protein n=1 Tax=Kwoniella newhampshirensis TaxID=1651941 RepID=A0AAW0YKN5_9TREE